MWPFPKPEELNHWIAAAENFSHSPREFYTACKAELEARRVPDLTFEEIEFAEGGLLSARRTYLRVRRERLVFDICAAPFGTGYFFSCRTLRLPVSVTPLHLLVLLLSLGALWWLMHQCFGLLYGGVMTLLFLLAALATLRNVATQSFLSADALLTRLPVIGTVYEAWFKRDTYHRHDSRLMYLDLIPHLVEKLSGDVTGARGVKLIRQYQVAPILGELYQPVVPRTAGHAA